MRDVAGAESDGQWHGMGIECMAVRYNPMDEYYYAFGGGEEIVLTRSKNLRCVHLLVPPQPCLPVSAACATDKVLVTVACSVGSWEGGYSLKTAPRGHLWGRGILMETGCTYLNESCAPSTTMSRIAPGYFTNYWANQSDQGGTGRLFLKNLTSWQGSVNDADFCDESGSGPTRFIYGMSCQNRKPGASGKCGNFYSVGIFDGNESEWLSSYFST